MALRLPAQPAAGADAWLGRARGVHAPVSARTAQRLTAVAIVPMVAATLWLVATSDHLQRPVASALYWSYLTAAPMAIGLFWWIRRPASRFGPLLITFGVLAWIVSWESSDWPLPFDIGVLVEGPTFWLTFYLFLAFPMGRLEPAAARWLMAALGLGILVSFLPWALFSPVIAGGGPLTRCAPNCPENVLQLGSAPDLVEVAGKAETYIGLVLTVLALLIYVRRLRAASRPQRRALTAVAVTSLLFLPGVLRLQLRRLDPPRRPADRGRPGVGDRRRARPAAARVPDRAAAGGAVRGEGAAQPARAARRAPDAQALAGDDRGGARRSLAAARLLRAAAADASATPTGRTSRARPPAPGASGCRSCEPGARWPRW